MLPDDVFRQLTNDRRHEREREALAERLAVRARERRSRDDEGPARIAVLGHLVAARRHAMP